MAGSGRRVSYIGGWQGLKEGLVLEVDGGRDGKGGLVI